MKFSIVKDKFSSIFQILKMNISVSKKGFFLLTIFAIIASGLPSIQLVLTEEIGTTIENMSNNRNNGIINIDNLIILLFAQSSIIIGKIILDLLSKIIENRISIKVFFFMESSIKSKLLKIKMSMFEDSDIYDQIQIASRVAPQFGLNLFKNIVLFIQTSLSIIFIIYVLRNIPLIGLTLLISLSIINILLSRMFNKTQMNIYYETSEQTRKRDQFSALLENRNIANEIRMFKIGNYFLNQWKQLFWKIENPQIKLTNKRNVLYHSLLILTQCIQFTILITEITRNPQNLVGTFLLITQAILLFQSQSSQLIECYNQINQITFYVPSYLKVMSLPEEDPQINSQIFHGLKSNIKVTNLSFKYKNASELALKNLNFEINKGEKIAIIGYNGSGKTTLVKCLLGLYDNYEGAIKYDDVPVQNLNKDSFRKHVAVLLQHFGKYPLTLKENIAIGEFQTKSDHFKLQNSLELSNIIPIAQSLPQGIDTILSPEFEGGVDLSGGQWQKVGLARVYYRDPSIFFLDEPTSAVDPISETKIYKDFLKSTIGKTSVILTHRLGICKWVDKIIVMENGKIIEMGSHDDLLEKGTVYKEMYNSQAEWYESSSHNITLQKV